MNNEWLSGNGARDNFPWNLRAFALRLPGYPAGKITV
jgi:hypothetical protein